MFFWCANRHGRACRTTFRFRFAQASHRHPEERAEREPRRATATIHYRLLCLARFGSSGAVHPSRLASLAPQDDGERCFCGVCVHSAANKRHLLFQQALFHHLRSKPGIKPAHDECRAD
jgi:hypothetical protein